MKYKDYKQLTDDQKEEWMIRFQGKDIPFYCIFVIAIMGVFIGLFGMIYIVDLSYSMDLYDHVMPESEHMNDQSQFFSIVANVISWSGIVVLSLSLLCSIYSVCYSVLEILFIRKCKKINTQADAAAGGSCSSKPEAKRK